MNQLLKKILLGILLWGFVYVASLLILPINQTDLYFFKTLIGFIFTFFAVVITVVFFMGIHDHYLQEGISAGIIWLLINIAIDIPIFIYGKMNMAFIRYFDDIGLTYVAIPVITIATGYLLEKKKKS